MRIAIGTAQFGLPYGIANKTGQVGQEEIKEILNLARLNHIDNLDTAISYGESEACLGEAGLNCFKVITKLPACPEEIKNINDWVNDQIQGSLKRLKISSLYAALLHRPEQLLTSKGEALWQSLENLKKDRLVKKIGVSISNPSELDHLSNNFSVDFIQAPFNLIDRRLASSGWLHKLHLSGIEVHTRSAFLQGLLLMPINEIPKKFRNWLPLFNTWHDWLLDNNISALNACIGFVQMHSQIEKFVVGVESTKQLRQLIQVEKEPISIKFPGISCNDEQLINPSNWNLL